MAQEVENEIMCKPMVIATNHAGVCRLEFNQPASLNSLVPDMADAALVAVRAVESDRSARVLVVSGRGRAFMAGGDLVYLRDNSPEMARQLAGDLIDQLNELVLAIRALSIPTLAVVHGSVAGAGLSLMLACDFAIAADDCKFHYAYSRIGAPPDGGLSQLLPGAVGRRRAQAFAFLDQPLTGAQALDLGLVTELSPADRLVDAGGILTEKLLHVPQPAFGHTKRLLAMGEEATLIQAMAAEREAFRDCIGTPDFREGINAFFKRQPPTFARRIAS